VKFLNEVRTVISTSPVDCGDFSYTVRGYEYFKTGHYSSGIQRLVEGPAP
jgi:hypothetical protein